MPESCRVCLIVGCSPSDSHIVQLTRLTAVVRLVTLPADFSAQLDCMKMDISPHYSCKRAAWVVVKYITSTNYTLLGPFKMFLPTTDTASNYTFTNYNARCSDKMVTLCARVMCRSEMVKPRNTLLFFQKCHYDLYLPVFVFHKQDR